MMAKPIGPREAALRVQREQRFQQNNRKEPREAKKAAAVKALGQAQGASADKLVPRGHKKPKNPPRPISEA